MTKDLNDYYYPEYLEHFGVKGMKWGVRREARRDAKESARAKMYYGEGAGVRRRNINAIVKQKSKDPTYKAEYEKAYAKQDLSKARRSAQRQRTITDKTKGFRQGTGRVGRAITREATAAVGFAAATAASAAITYAIKNPKEARAFIQNAGRMASAEVKIGATIGKSFLRNHGFNL